MKIIVVGGHGFVGKSLVKRLIDYPCEVFPLSRIDGFDLTDLHSTKKYFSDLKPDVIVNCAAHVGSVHYGLKYPASIVHDNLMMILNLFKAAQEECSNAMMVNLIANCAYPMHSDIQRESEMWEGMPHNTALPFASTRRMIYVVSKSYMEQFGLKSKNLVLPGVYGPGNHNDIERVHALDGIIIRMINALNSKNEEFEIWGTGKPVREWCYIDDVINIIIKSIELDNKSSIDPINIGQKTGYSIKELAEITANIMSYNGILTFNTNYPDGAEIKVLDNTLFKKMFPSYKFVSIEKGIRKAVDYYQSVI
jgi:GDP-L-fucose synthase